MSGLKDEYQERYEKVLQPIAAKLESEIKDYLGDRSRIDRVTSRPKSVQRFLKKAEASVNGGFPKYSEPLRQIQDQIGARIVVYYLSDIEPVAKIMQKYFFPIEEKDMLPESEWEFGYVGKHFIFHLPKSLIATGTDPNLVPEFFELQLKTLFQHAWSEAEHDLGYKTFGKPLNSDQKRKLAFAAAQSWGGDMIFDELFTAAHS